MKSLFLLLFISFSGSAIFSQIVVSRVDVFDTTTSSSLHNAYGHIKLSDYFNANRFKHLYGAEANQLIRCWRSFETRNDLVFCDENFKPLSADDFRKRLFSEETQEQTDSVGNIIGTRTVYSFKDPANWSSLTFHENWSLNPINGNISKTPMAIDFDYCDAQYAVYKKSFFSLCTNKSTRTALSKEGIPVSVPDSKKAISKNTETLCELIIYTVDIGTQQNEKNYCSLAAIEDLLRSNKKTDSVLFCLPHNLSPANPKQIKKRMLRESTTKETDSLGNVVGTKTIYDTLTFSACKSLTFYESWDLNPDNGMIEKEVLAYTINWQDKFSDHGRPFITLVRNENTRKKLLSNGNWK